MVSLGFRGLAREACPLGLSFALHDYLASCFLPLASCGIWIPVVRSPVGVIVWGPSLTADMADQEKGGSEAGK